MSYEVGNGSRHTPSGVPEMLDTPPSHMIPHRLCRIRYQNKYDTASYARMYQAVMTADKQTTQSECRDVDEVFDSTYTFTIIMFDGQLRDWSRFPRPSITSTKNKFFAIAESFFMQKNSLPSEKLHIFKSQISFSDILSSCRTPSGLQATAPEMPAANIFLHLFSF